MAEAVITADEWLKKAYDNLRDWIYSEQCDFSKFKPYVEMLAPEKYEDFRVLVYDFGTEFVVNHLKHQLALLASGMDYMSVVETEEALLPFVEAQGIAAMTLWGQMRDDPTFGLAAVSQQVCAGDWHFLFQMLLNCIQVLVPNPRSE
jgi:hypothetical protein